MVKVVNTYFEAIGRRKSAVARVRLYDIGKQKSIEVLGTKLEAGRVAINKKSLSDFFPLAADAAKYAVPLELTGQKERFAVSIVVRGGGHAGQLDAIILGVSRALEKVDRDEHRPSLKKAGLLKRDPRVRESRKVGTGGKARRKKQSPKR